LLASGADALIVRTQWLYGVPGRSFPRVMWDRATMGLPTRVVDDQFGRPTSTSDLAHASWELIAHEARGVYHVANEGTASWFDVACAVFEAAGAGRPHPCSSAEYASAARRPKHTVLDTEKVRREHGIRLPHWRSSLDRFIETVRLEAPAPAV
jgi:dTDP-4-dehydrorhamnose reductase